MTLHTVRNKSIEKPIITSTFYVKVMTFNPVKNQDNKFIVLYFYRLFFV